MKYLKYGFLALIAICLLIVALANRAPVELKLLPDDLAGYLGGQPFAYQLPLFLVIFLFIAIGLLIGFVWEWLREHKYRAEGRAQRREKHKLEREVSGLKQQRREGRDEVLAILDETQTAR